MNYRANNQNRNKSGLITALIFLFVNMAFSQSSFPINDPRNPNCPCHKYQKLADDEFKNLLAQNNAVNNEKGISEDEQGKLHKQFNQANKQLLEGLSSDELARISIIEGQNVLGVNNESPGELKVVEQKTNRLIVTSAEAKINTAKHWKGKRKKHTAHYKQLKRIFYVDNWGIWKRKKITTACFHWK